MTGTCHTVHVNIDCPTVVCRNIKTFFRTIGCVNGYIPFIGIDSHQIIGLYIRILVIRICFQCRPSYSYIYVAVQINGTSVSAGSGTDSGRRPTGTCIVITAIFVMHVSVRTISAMHFLGIDPPILVVTAVCQCVLQCRIPDSYISVNNK